MFRVRDREAPERALALKHLSQSGGSASGLLEAEFALLSRVRIAGLVRAHDFGRDDEGVPFLVEDFVESQDFDAVVGQRSERAKQWLVDVLLTLAALHDAGFVHGDLKPEHVRLPAHGRPVLVDLGCALELRGAGAREAVGLTRAYAAPEVLAGASPDVRSDLFGLGATFLALVGASAAQPSALRREAPWIAPSLAEVVAALVAPHPADRPRDARSALALLGRHPALKWDEHGRTSVGREDAIAEILEANAASVRYVVGPSGAGKSHTVREAGLRALVMGRESTRPWVGR